MSDSSAQPRPGQDPDPNADQQEQAPGAVDPTPEQPEHADDDEVIVVDESAEVTQDPPPAGEQATAADDQPTEESATDQPPAEQPAQPAADEATDEQPTEDAEQAVAAEEQEEDFFIGQEPPEVADPDALAEQQLLSDALAEQATTQAPMRARRPVPVNTGMKTFAIPVLFTVGLLLLIPGIWAIRFKMGATTWGSDKDNVEMMAMAMLACWPIAAVLIGYGLVLVFQVLKAKKRAAESQEQR